METIQQDRPVRKRFKQAQKCRRDTTTKIQKRSGSRFADAFLNNTFCPVICDPKIGRNWKQQEAYFIQCLRHLEADFKLKPISLTDDPYPFNIKAAFEQAKPMVAEKSYYKKLMLIENGSHPFCLAIAEEFGCSCTLYYIPLDMLLKIMRNKKRKAESRLLVTLCAYLYFIIKIPSYTKGDFISGIYDQFREWVENDEEQLEQKDLQTARSALNAAEHFARRFHRILSHPSHHEKWQQRHDCYKPKDLLGKRVLSLSRKFHALYRKYPSRKIYDQFNCVQFPDEYDEIMSADQYISFVWTNDGWLGAETVNYMNDSAGNYSGTEAPLEYTIYDTPGGRKPENLKFEKQLFLLMDDLVTLLYDLNDDKD